MLRIILLSLLILLPNQALAAGDVKTPKQLKWEFDGFFGRFDRASAQRGYQVYREVCASCHGMELLSYRNLEVIGFSKDEIKQIASEYDVKDGPNDEGQMFMRPGLPSERFAGPYANEKEARAANGGAYPVDLSLIIKARPDGANYVYSLLSGYEKTPKEFELAEGKYYNPYFAGGQISMPPPIGDDDLVEYGDGTVASKEQMIVDVVNFLQFAAEPEMEERKKMGIKVMIFLAIMTLLFAIAKKIVWRDIK